MSGEDAYKVYYQSLNAYEREEIKQFPMVYYLNLSMKRKSNAISDEDGKIYNFGYDT